MLAINFKMEMKKTIRNIIGAGLVALAGSSFAGPTTDMNVTGSLTEKFASRYVMGSGATASPGAVVQDTLRVGVGKYVGAWLFMNHDLTANQGPRGIDPNVVTFAPEVTAPLTKSLSLRQDAEVWTYQEHVVGKEKDFVTQTTLKYTGPITATASYVHFFPKTATKQIDRGVFTLAKPYKLVDEKEYSISATPSITAVYQDNHAGNHGLYHETAGLSVGVATKKYGLEACVNRQEGNSDHGKKNITTFGVAGKVNF